MEAKKGSSATPKTTVEQEGGQPAGEGRTWSDQNGIWEDWDMEGGDTTRDAPIQREEDRNEKARREEEWSREMRDTSHKTEVIPGRSRPPARDVPGCKTSTGNGSRLEVREAGDAYRRQRRITSSGRPDAPATGSSSQSSGGQSSWQYWRPQQRQRGQGADHTPAPEFEGEWWQNQRGEWKWWPKTSTSATTTSSAGPEDQENDY